MTAIQRTPPVASDASHDEILKAIVDYFHLHSEVTSDNPDGIAETDGWTLGYCDVWSACEVMFGRQDFTLSHLVLIMEDMDPTYESDSAIVLPQGLPTTAMIQLMLLHYFIHAVGQHILRTPELEEMLRDRQRRAKAASASA